MEWRADMAERMATEPKMGYRASKRGKYTRSDGRKISCRSVWERLTAEHLDAAGERWEFEDTVYTLEDSEEVYLPDFTVYAEDGTPKKVIEVKGYYSPENRKKMERFRKALKGELGIDLEVWDEKELRRRGILG